MILVSSYEGYLRLILVRAWEFHRTWTCYSDPALILHHYQLHTPLHSSLLAVGDCGPEGGSVGVKVLGDDAAVLGCTNVSDSRDASINDTIESFDHLHLQTHTHTHTHNLFLNLNI